MPATSGSDRTRNENDREKSVANDGLPLKSPGEPALTPVSDGFNSRPGRRVKRLRWRRRAVARDRVDALARCPGSQVAAELAAGARRAAGAARAGRAAAVGGRPTTVHALAAAAVVAGSEAHRAVNAVDTAPSRVGIRVGRAARAVAIALHWPFGRARAEAGGPIAHLVARAGVARHAAGAYRVDAGLVGPTRLVATSTVLDAIGRVGFTTPITVAVGSTGCAGNGTIPRGDTRLLRGAVRGAGRARQALLLLLLAAGGAASGFRAALGARCNAGRGGAHVTSTHLAAGELSRPRPLAILLRGVAVALRPPLSPASRGEGIQEWSRQRTSEQGAEQGA